MGIYLAVLLLILGVIGTAMFIVYQSENIGKQVAGIFEGEHAAIRQNSLQIQRKGSGDT